MWMWSVWQQRPRSPGTGLMGSGAHLSLPCVGAKRHVYMFTRGTCPSSGSTFTPRLELTTFSQQKLCIQYRGPHNNSSTYPFLPSLPKSAPHTHAHTYAYYPTLNNNFFLKFNALRDSPVPHKKRSRAPTNNPLFSATIMLSSRDTMQTSRFADFLTAWDSMISAAPKLKKEKKTFWPHWVPLPQRYSKCSDWSTGLKSRT